MIKIKKKEFQKLYSLACNNWIPKLNEKFKTQIFSEELEFEESFFEEMRKACTKEQLEVFNIIFKSYIKEEIDYTKTVKNYSDVCKELKIKELTEKDFKQFGDDAKKMLAFHQLKNIEKLFNKGWTPDFNNFEYKYYPYFIYNNGGLSFFVSHCFSCYFDGCVALFKDRNTSNFIGKIFLNIYKNII